METAARAPTDVVHKDQAPVQPMLAGPTVDTNPTTASQSQTSPGYLQSARETLASIAGTVQNAVGIDTPASTLHSIADNAKINASMPSSETSGARTGEHVGGVGSLPGDNKEEGVARLPAERMSVPSREYEGSHPGEKSGGVGALPGHLSESNVALLPDERGTQVKEGVQASEGIHAREGIHATGGLHATEGIHAREGTRSKEGVQSSARATLHPSSKNPDKADVKTAAAHPIETAKQARRDSTSSSSSSEGERDPNAPKRKTTIKDKVAGGMKTAMGKIKKDEELVAEGKAQRGH
ncbi:unnamed protein product [Rhizoctonia solani]|uniref:CsbD-like domain-containing protein n=1 Tax=Rhizoctonia solani TaxID=456999 RepID=A0A8H3HGN8_9AGAM|nr:unnamed protein product [Rhizoctonia solani]